MANNKTTDQPGSNDKQSGHGSRNQQVHDTSSQRPNGEQTMTNSNKTKQGDEDDHTTESESKQELADERGGHGHSGHSSSRSGSDSNA